MTENQVRQVALIGFGEVGGIFGHDLSAGGIRVAVFDILLISVPSRAALLAKAKDAGVSACDSAEVAIRGADLVISAVTCSAAADVARNSAARLRSIGMNATAVSERIGVASAVKMCRSVMIKGIEALAVESLFAARRYGAEKEVLASLAATYPHMGWDGALPDYLISRVAEHGRRRAAEMREAAETLRNIGLEPLTALATAERQDWLVREMAERNISVRPGEPFSWQDLADAIAKAFSTDEKAAGI
jgi:3-hydroxyisobutyrate dehydrogenase-like beta-hydroxyacid dehydrogenase